MYVSNCIASCDKLSQLPNLQFATARSSTTCPKSDVGPCAQRLSYEKEKASDEVDCKLSYDAVINIPWTGKTDFDACIKDNLADGHPAKAAGLGKGDRLIGISGKDVRVLPFNGVLKHLKSKLKEKKGDIQFRFKNLSDEYWDEFYKKKEEQASFDDDDLFA